VKIKFIKLLLEETFRKTSNSNKNPVQMQNKLPLCQYKKRLQKKYISLKSMDGKKIHAACHIFYNLAQKEKCPFIVCKTKAKHFPKKQ